MVARMLGPAVRICLLLAVVSCRGAAVADDASAEVLTLRVARPTDHLDQVSAMYVAGLGFEVLGSFEDHEGFDGVMLGHPKEPYHLEFTAHRGHPVGRAPTQDHLLVFYVPEEASWLRACERMVQAGFREVPS